MLIRLALALSLACAAPAAAFAREAMRQYFAETPTGIEELTGELSRRLPPGVSLVARKGLTLVSWSGASLPPGLGGFLASAFPDLDPALLEPGRTMSVVASLTPDGNGTAMSLMVLARFPAPAIDLPEGASVLLDATGRGPCEGQVVAKHAGAPSDVARLWRAHFEGQGFLFDADASRETSFFVGYAEGCALGLYVRRDGTATLVVARYLED